MDTHAHTHPADLEACLDLINSLRCDDGVPTEALTSAEAAAVFLADLGLAQADALRLQSARDRDWLATVIDGRDALRDLWDALVGGRSPASDTVERLNRILRHAPATELRVVPGGVAVGHRHAQDDPTAEALARATLPLLDAIAAGDTARFRVCANDGCRWVFEDTSRGGHRRWCSMASCGNRAKVRRYRTRRREPEALPAAAAPPTPPTPR